MKKFFVILTAICMVAGALCISAFAADTAPGLLTQADTVPPGVVLRVSAQKNDNTIMVLDDYKSIQDGWNAAAKLAMNSETMNTKDYNRIVVDVYTDWVATGTGNFGSGDGFAKGSILFPEKTKLTLDMNGHSIKCVVDEALLDGEIIYVANGADVIINDATVTGGKSANGAGGIHIKEKTSVVLNNVNVTDNSCAYSSNGAGIAVYDDSTLIMNGGSISKNGLSGTYACGALYANEATVTLNNVTVSDNATTSADAEGVAIYADESTVNLNNCVISNNATSGNGKYAESVIAADKSDIIITNTDLTGNGGVSSTSDIDYSHLFYLEDSYLSFDGGKITGNKADKLFYFDDSEANIKNVTVTDNDSVVFDVDNGSEIVALTDCVLGNNRPVKYEEEVIVDEALTLTMTDCSIGDTTFEDKEDVKFMYVKITKEEALIGVSVLLKDGTTTTPIYYKHFVNAWNDAMGTATTSKDYERVIVDLYADWNAVDAEFTSAFFNGAGFDWDAIFFPERVRVTLNGNGHTINMGARIDSKNGEVMCVAPNADVVINDATIKGGWSSTGAGGIHIKANARVMLNNVNLIDNKTAGSNGSAIAVYDGATLIMNGGSISENRLEEGYIFDYIFPVTPCSTLHVEDATATLNKVTISNNTVYGGDIEGVALYAENSTVTLNECIVEGNASEGTRSRAESIVGAVYSKLIINNTDFINNATYVDSDDECHLFYLENSTLAMEGGNIKGNKADEIFYFADSKATIKGVTITDNASIVAYVDNAVAKVTMTECVLGNNTPAEDEANIIVEAKNTLVMTNCTLGDTTFEDKNMIEGAGSVFGEGSLAMTVSLLALIASVASVGLFVSLKKKIETPEKK